MHTAPDAPICPGGGQYVPAYEITAVRRQRGKANSWTAKYAVNVTCETCRRTWPKLALRAGDQVLVPPHRQWSRALAPDQTAEQLR